ncbi:MAG: PAC2 family protein [Candidatus Nanoarchaeia archaeon]
MATPLLPDLSKTEKRMSPTIKIRPTNSNLGDRDLNSVIKHVANGYKKLQLKLKIKPRKNAIIIEGFPGFGFVATIAVEFLMDHLKMHSIGSLWSPKLPPLVFVHNNRLVQPLEILHNDKYNLVVLEAVTGIGGMEWEVADALLKLYKKIDAKEIISIEGIGGPIEKKMSEAYYYTNQETLSKKYKAIGLSTIREGVIFGPSAALMLKADKDINASAIFAETHSNLPDYKAAAKIIEVLDKYLGLKVDYKLLLKRAGEFEERLKAFIEKAKEASEMKKNKEQEMPYIG